jgi:menaquinone-dependent protoporphyrinogen IX oxidase
MNDQKFALVAYGTRYGSTAEIAKKIANTIEKNNISSKLLNLEKKHIDLTENYDGIIVGTSLKANSFTKGVQTFLESNREFLNNKNSKFAMFTCGAFAIGELRKAKADLKNKLTETYELDPDLHDAFAGVIDLSKDSKVGFFGKLILKIAAKGIKKEMNIDIDTKSRNDFRDWSKIEHFALEFVSKIQK